LTGSGGYIEPGNFSGAHAGPQVPGRQGPPKSGAPPGGS
jgi:hypothetical protein